MTLAARRFWIRARNRSVSALWILAVIVLGWILVSTTMSFGTRVAAATVRTAPL